MEGDSKKAYVVNAKTNKVDTWDCIGSMGHKDGSRSYVLERGSSHTVLPEKCVFFDKKKAREVARKYKTK